MCLEIRGNIRLLAWVITQRESVTVCSTWFPFKCLYRHTTARKMC